MDLQQVFEQLNKDSFAIMQAKNHDYSGAGGDAFSNFRLSEKLGIPPAKGLCLRMMDKHQRIRTFIDKGTLKVVGESVKDAVMDCFNYSILLNGLTNHLTSQLELFESRKALVASSYVDISWFDSKFDVKKSLDIVEEAMSYEKYKCSLFLLHYARIAKELEVYGS